MSKSLFTAVLFGLFALVSTAQEKDSIPNTKNQEVDSLQNDLKKEGIVVIDTLKKKKVRINPLAPSKAAFYSAVFPGLGQIYNKRYWKAPIVWGAIGAAIYGYTLNDNQYNIARTAFKRRQAGFTDDELFDRNGDGVGPDFGLDDLQNIQEARQRDRDLWLLAAIGVYVLNIIDANVDAHLKQFNVDEDLSFDMQPFLNRNPITNIPNYGMAVVVKF